jgi:tetratricopeptide (TPR) repeat protein
MMRQDQALVAQEQALTMLLELDRLAPTNENYQATLADAYNNLGRGLVRHPTRGREAEAPFRDALRIRQVLAEKHPERPQDQHELGLVLLNLGNHISNYERRAEAETLWMGALKIFNQLIALNPGSPDYRQGLSVTYDRLGRVCADTKRWERADEHFRESVSILEDLVADFPRRTAYRRNLADQYYQIGFRQFRDGRTNQTQLWVEKAIAVQEQLAQADPESDMARVVLSIYYGGLGQIHESSARLAEAERAYRRSIDFAEQAVALHPAFHRHREGLANASRLLARFCASQAMRRGEADVYWRKTIRTGEDLLARAPDIFAFRDSLAHDYARFSRWCLESHRPGDAVATCEKAISLFKTLETAQSVTNWTGHMAAQWAFAKALSAARRDSEAAELFQKLLPQLQLLTAAHPDDPAFSLRKSEAHAELDTLRQRMP